MTKARSTMTTARWICTIEGIGAWLDLLINCTRFLRTIPDTRRKRQRVFCMRHEIDHGIYFIENHSDTGQSSRRCISGLSLLAGLHGYKGGGIEK